MIKTREAIILSTWSIYFNHAELRRRCSRPQRVKKANDLAEARSAALKGRVAHLETVAGEQSDAITALENEVTRMKKEITMLKDRAEDLEAMSRRCNIGVVGVGEGQESGKRPLQFIADMLRELLQLDKTSVLDRAHRALRSKPTHDNQPPRAFIAKCHYFQEKEEILRKAAALQQLKTSNMDSSYTAEFHTGCHPTTSGFHRGAQPVALM